MASRKQHNALCRLFGIPEKKADRINAEIDLPVKEFGPSHRKYRHDFRSAVLMAMLERDAKVLVIHRLHTLLDQNKDLEKIIRILQ